MPGGTVEHELCPVVIAEVAGSPAPDPLEVHDLRWLSWADVVARADGEPWTLSPWSVEQVRELNDLQVDPKPWLAGTEASAAARLLDRPVGVTTPRHGPKRATGGALEIVHDAVGTTLDGFLAAKAAETVALDPVLGEVTGEIRSLVDAGGKRLRPAFAYWGYRATGADHDDAVLRPASAIELLHTFALLHDDVMDRSPTRRGRPAAHAALAAAHTREHRIGDPTWFGASAAILAGDLTYVWADDLFDDTPWPIDAINRARAVFSELRREVIAGQYLDLVLAADDRATEAAARRVALLKSARYTVTRPLLLGAALAPAADGARVAPALHGYGDAVGIAFQMRDDVLGLFGDPSVTGKSSLDDLREGKQTLLVLRALRLGDDRQRAFLRTCLGDPTLDEARAEQARHIVAATGALASIESLIEAHHTMARAAIEAIPAPAEAALAELADRAICRRS
jgi:geranylgeranyl diphosphate synthase type I